MIRPTRAAAALLTSLLLNGPILVILERNLAAHLHHTADSFPTPFDRNFGLKCGVEYLGVPFICDPDRLMSKTEADHISDSHFFGPASFRSCVFDRNCKIFNYRRSSGPVDTRPTVGIALVSRPFSDDFCRRKWPLDVGVELADLIRKRWSNADCEVDVFLLCSAGFHCHNRSAVDPRPPLRHFMRRRSTDTRLFLSLNDRFRLSEADWLAVRRLSTRPAAHCADRISEALRLLQKLLPRGTFPVESVANRHSSGRTASGSKRDSPFTPIRHSIPSWAILVFAGCALLTCLCLFLGHLVNRASSLKKRRSLASEAANVALHKKHDRRWGAGFGGGLIEIQNKSQTGANATGGGRNTSKKQASLFKGFAQSSQKQSGGGGRANNPWGRI